MTTLFISDLHLDPRHPQTALALGQLLQHETAKIDALYILGDLFEAWIGDDFEHPFLDQIKVGLRAVTAAGVPGYIMHGNRDFLIGEKFCEETGFTLLDDPTLVELDDGRRALLMHGDTLCTQDVKYQELRKMVRDPAWQAAALAKSIPERLAAAQELRDMSQAETGDKAEEIMDVTESEVVRVMAEHDVDLLIHGHTHRPAIHDLEINGKSAQRVVLGDWYKRGWTLHYFADGKFELKDFSF